MGFKIGDKVNIPTTKSVDDHIDLSYLHDYKEDYLIIKSVEGNSGRCGLGRIDNGYFPINLFHINDLTLYEEPTVYKGDIKGFPKEVVDKMLERQVEQDNFRDVSVFERERRYGIMDKGFDWEQSNEGYLFWEEVLDNKNFDVFFKLYPKTNTMEKEIIGYKLIKPEYNDVALKIANAQKWLNKQYINFDIKVDCKAYTKLKEAGILDLWFEPVYKPVFKADDFIFSASKIRKIAECKYTNADSYLYWREEGEAAGTMIHSMPIGDVRLATPEEITKWRKENEFNLPVIANNQCVDNGNETITCGCTTKHFEWLLGVENALSLSAVNSIFIKGTGVTINEIQQIVKYINHKRKNS